MHVYMHERGIARQDANSRDSPADGPVLDTNKKHLREGAVEPKFKTPSRPGKLDPYADRLAG